MKSGTWPINSLSLDPLNIIRSPFEDSPRTLLFFTTVIIPGISSIVGERTTVPLSLFFRPKSRARYHQTRISFSRESIGRLEESLRDTVFSIFHANHVDAQPARWNGKFSSLVLVASSAQRWLTVLLNNRRTMDPSFPDRRILLVLLITRTPAGKPRPTALFSFKITPRRRPSSRFPLR